MSKAPSQEKTQQDLHKYWNSVTPNTTARENNHPISSNNEPNIANKRTDQLNSNNSDQTTKLNDKKRKAPVQRKLQEETSSPLSKRMHETTKNKDEFLRSSSSSNLHVRTNLNPSPNINPNPSWMVEMERRLENNLTINLT